MDVLQTVEFEQLLKDLVQYNNSRERHELDYRINLLTDGDIIYLLVKGKQVTPVRSLSYPNLWEILADEACVIHNTICSLKD